MLSYAPRVPPVSLSLLQNKLHRSTEEKTDVEEAWGNVTFLTHPLPALGSWPKWQLTRYKSQVQLLPQSHVGSVTAAAFSFLSSL